MFRQFLHCILPVSFLVLVGCASSGVKLETSANVPEPLINPYPFHAAIYFPEATRGHHYQQDDRDGKPWSVRTGASQTALFKQIAKSMFSATSVVKTLEEAKQDYDVVLIPRISDMQFAVPRETGLDHFEVWIEYEMLVTRPEGKAIAIIPFKGYGKSPKAFFTDDSKGLYEAASLAFRDLGAKFIVSFIQNPDIQKWRLSAVAKSPISQSSPDKPNVFESSNPSATGN